MSTPTMYESFTTGLNSWSNPYGTSWLAQSILAESDHHVSSIMLPFWKNVSAYGDQILSVRHALITNPDLDQAIRNGSGFGTVEYGWCLFTLENGLDWTNGELYILVCRRPTGSYATYWQLDSAGSPYVNGQRGHSGDSGSSWTWYGTSDHGFQIWDNLGIKTQAPTAILTESCQAHGIVVGDISQRGFEWGTSYQGVYSDDQTEFAGEGSYSMSITGLTPGTTYYIRAKAYDDTLAAWIYGDEQVFSTYLTPPSRGGNPAGALVAEGLI